MKKCSGIFMLMLLLCTGLQAQFVASAVPEVIAGNSIGVSKTSTDVKPVPTAVGNQLLYVAAWDGNAPGIRWDVPGAALGGFLPLPAGSLIPDVAISSTAAFGNTYLIVVYRNGANFVVTRWQWGGAGFGVGATGVLLALGLGASPPSINIDADFTGNYAVVTGQPNGAISVYDGTNAALPALPVFRSVLAAGTGFQADICINNNGAAATVEQVSYTNPAATSLFRRSRPFGAGVFGAAIVVAPAAAGVTYRDPRIAAPRVNPAGVCAGTNNICSIVFIFSSPNGNFLQMHNVRCAAPVTVTTGLANGAAGFPVPLLLSNRRPVVSYNSAFDYTSPGFLTDGATTVLWTFLDPAFVRSTLGERVRTNGNIWPGLFGYYEVTNPLRPDGEYASVSSKYSGNVVFVSFYDVVTNNILVKRFAYNAATMRTAGQDAEAELVNGRQQVDIFPNPSKGDIQVRFTGLSAGADIKLQVTDVTGKMILNTQNTGNRLQQQVQTWFSSATPGLYFVRFSNDNGLNSLTKLIKE